MLSPRCPSALGREAALEILIEMERLQCRDRQLEELLVALRGLVDTSDRARETAPIDPAPARVASEPGDAEVEGVRRTSLPYIAPMLASAGPPPGGSRSASYRGRPSQTASGAVATSASSAATKYARRAVLASWSPHLRMPGP